MSGMGNEFIFHSFDSNIIGLNNFIFHFNINTIINLWIFW
ncbi:hypothetical protein EDC20_10777 [Gluconobacter oxydans]|nr:hypothetical protein EDC20_10777 [Gluconobacter oxydans]